MSARRKVGGRGSMDSIDDFAHACGGRSARALTLAMKARHRRAMRSAWLLAVALACAIPARAQDLPPATELLARAERDRTADNPAFRATLAQLDTSARQLTETQRWYLRYLHAWQQDFSGDIEAPSALCARSSPRNPTR